ncbi:hypothetical protein EYR36_003949 [Pleurotus pulmonarius]|nr:hypothetical protein EYR36_003949 [Pleurotus pulmonarius]
MFRVKLNDEQLRNVVAGPGDVEWRYEMRRECQEILPGLLLGPFVASKSLETLQSLKITHIVCIRDAKEAFSVRPRFPQQFTYMTLDVEDNEEQNLIRLFPAAKKFIDDAISRSGRVLVHCNGGISLSPAFVWCGTPKHRHFGTKEIEVMFVMQYYNMSWEDALHTVQNRRYCISPNGGFLTQIKEYEAIYKASLALEESPYQNSNNVSRRKRDDDDDDRAEDRKRPLVEMDGDDPDAMQT